VASLFQKHTDEELVVLYKQQKDSSIVGELFTRHYHLALGVCLKYLKDHDTAKDAVMQIFEKLMDDLSKHEIQYFCGWLYRVSQNFCLMILRSRKYQAMISENLSDTDMEYEDGVHPSVRKEEMLTQLEHEISQLSEDQRRCIELFYLEKKTYTEIMALTQYTFMQVKSHIQNGKRNLKIKLAGIHE
jgi:RNA polymerase sigma-70 factor (ECF subfamily)